MTDRERFLALLDEWGVGYNGENAKRNLSREDLSHDVILCQGDPKIIGYTDFLAVFEFEPDGTFKQIGVWE